MHPTPSRRRQRLPILHATKYLVSLSLFFATNHPVSTAFTVPSELVRTTNPILPSTTASLIQPSPRLAHYRNIHHQRIFPHISSFSLSSSSSNEDPFLSSLRSRVLEVTSRASVLPLVVLDSMLPRQTLELPTVRNEAFVSLLRERIGSENPTLGMLGTARLADGRYIRLRHGVEVEILGRPRLVEGGEESVEMVRLRGGRRFVLDGDVEYVDGGWTEARVRFFGDDNEENEDDSDEDRDSASFARAITKSKEFTAPNFSTKDGLSLVEQWIELAKQNERTPGQIDELLEGLGSIPSTDDPSDRAFWVGALINPIPAMGVAMEVRPSLLVAERAEERVDVALDGLLRSIRHMDGSERMW